MKTSKSTIKVPYQTTQKRTVLVKLTIGVLFFTLCYSCVKEDAYLKYTEKGEIVYPGKPDSIIANSGNNRVMLSWILKGYPNMDSYLVKWNQGRDSLLYKLNRSAELDTVRILLDKNIAEGPVTFVIYANDKQGNRSLPTEITAVAYGEGYSSLLANRRLNTSKPYSVNAMGELVLHFDAPDTINISTNITYTTKTGTTNRIRLDSESSDAVIKSYSSGTKILMQSSYIPQANAIDTFLTSRADSITIHNIKMDKGLYKALSLPYDVKSYDANTTLERLWDGNTTATNYPNIFHSDGNNPLPHHFTIDLGRVYERLTDIELIGRTSDHNPTELEVWGTDNIENGTTDLPGNDPNWITESVAKGWKLLGKVSRADNGSAAMKFSLQEVSKPIRYIRLRVIKVASGSTIYSNLSEISFWNKL